LAAIVLPGGASMMRDYVAWQRRLPHSLTATRTAVTGLCMVRGRSCGGPRAFLDAAASVQCPGSTGRQNASRRHGFGAEGLSNGSSRRPHRRVCAVRGLGLGRSRTLADWANCPGRWKEVPSAESEPAERQSAKFRARSALMPPLASFER
jgi:hypothetical protein